MRGRRFPRVTQLVRAQLELSDSRVQSPDFYSKGTQLASKERRAQRDKEEGKERERKEERGRKRGEKEREEGRKKGGRGKGRGRSKLGIYDDQIQTAIHQKDQQGYSGKHRELYSISCNNLYWNII